jgi:hypothetical protein
MLKEAALVILDMSPEEVWVDRVYYENVSHDIRSHESRTSEHEMGMLTNW